MRRKRTRKVAATGPGGNCGEPASVAESREPGAESRAPSPPWWQGAWQALGGFFNLLAALAGRWPKHGV